MPRSQTSPALPGSSKPLIGTLHRSLDPLECRRKPLTALYDRFWDIRTKRQREPLAIGRRQPIGIGYD
jgi:hypothetical protein